MLSVENLNSGYGKFQILFDISLRAEKRKITAVIGPNGSGKSTLLKSIFGLCTIYSGRIILGEKEISKLKPHLIARMGVAYLPQLGNIFENLTVLENLRIATFISSEKKKRTIHEVLEFFPVLKERLNTKASTLSGGERQMLAMAMALLREPKLIMFDEPSAGLAPKICDYICEKIVELRENFGMTILLVEQNVKKALEICDYVYLLVAGKNVFSGTPEELLSHPELPSMYLGLKAK